VTAQTDAASGHKAMHQCNENDAVSIPSLLAEELFIKNELSKRANPSQVNRVSFNLLFQVITVYFNTVDK
jgi:hypothetical protein